MPIPRAWLNEAKQPRLRVVCAWNTPTNAAVSSVWACRKVGFQLRPSLGSDAPLGRGRTPGSYPLIDRVYELRSDKLKIESDEWMAEISYEEKAQYPNQMQVDDHQRVSVVLELFDGGEGGVSPQVAVQAMPAANTMIRLGTARQPIWAPIRIPTG